ncbi:hypothetical protein FOA52_011419 [Chlamydomonas sp. UWO 241]|nr:hypothetical protein FOA52_011419 [Chlamydomonas sp. UWO 241]
MQVAGPARNAPGLRTTPGMQRKRKLGMLQSVPAVPQPQETLASAIKRASRCTPSSGIKNEAEKERNRAARQMDTLMKELSVPLTRFLGAFPKYESLHPFEQALLQLTVGAAQYVGTLAKVDSLRKSLQQTGKSFAARASDAPNKAGAVQIASEGLEQLTNIYSGGAKHIEALRDIARKLRGLPAADVSLPTVALVGAPNVGKSSLVQLLSTGLPEICNYPFTTRSIKMGHFYIDGTKHQVTDTPGLLNRPDEERNKMELLTLATLQHLPTTVLFVVDLTEECGTSVEDQWAIRCEIAARFPTKPWIDVFSKEDEIGGILADGAEMLAARRVAAAAAAGGGDAAGGSDHDGSDFDGPGSGSTSSVTDPPAGTSVTTSSSGASGDARAVSAASVSGDAQRAAAGALGALGPGEWGPVPASVGGPEDFFAALPAALPVSSLTDVGLPELKERIIDVLAAAYQQTLNGWEEEGEGADAGSSGGGSGCLDEEDREVHLRD